MDGCNHIKKLIRRTTPTAKSALQDVDVRPINVCVVVRLCDRHGDAPLPKLHESTTTKDAPSGQAKRKAPAGIII